MFNYCAYGLAISSNVAIPEFTKAELAEEDVSITVDPDFPIPQLEETIPDFIQITPEKSVLFERLLGTFLVYEGKKVIVVPAPNATIELIRIYLVGTVMAMVLHQRGCLILHGSGVVIDGKAVAFVGRSGWGKSSIAAALAQMGYPLVSDDIFALDLSSNQPVVYPGFSQYKVSEETAQVLGHQTSSLLNRDVQNRGYINCPNFTTKTLAVDRIYLLAKDAENGIESIKPIEVMTQLLRHSVPTIWSLPQPPEHFFQCSKLINTTPIYRLKRANDIASLPQLAKLVEQHARENSQNAIAI